MLTAITNYFENCILLDDKVVWEYVERKQQAKDQPESNDEILVEKLAISEQAAQQFEKS